MLFPRSLMKSPKAELAVCSRKNGLRMGPVLTIVSLLAFGSFFLASAEMAEAKEFNRRIASEKMQSVDILSHAKEIPSQRTGSIASDRSMNFSLVDQRSIQPPHWGFFSPAERPNFSAGITFRFERKPSSTATP